LSNRKRFDVELYQDIERKWRVRVKSSWNHKIILATTQGYMRKQSAIAAFESTARALALGDYRLNYRSGANASVYNKGA
jgi:uncharacterized protein YegP (UPF0339 family)